MSLMTPILTEQALLQLILGLRVAVAVSWAWIGYIGLKSFVRVAIGVHQRSDLGWSSMMLIAIGLLIFQWRALAGVIPPVADGWIAVALSSLLLSAAGILAVHSLKAPVAHQRGALIAHAGFLVVSFLAGALS